MQARKHLTALTALVAAAALFSGCGSTPAPEPAPPSVDASATLTLDALEGMSGQDVVTTLDQAPGPRPLAVAASVREHEVLISDGTSESSLPLPEDQFYLSFAPYVDSTHECYYHNVGTCQGELAETTVSVTIRDQDGGVLVAEDATTYANGFVGYWLPRGRTGTVEVSYDGRTGSVPFSTNDGDPTCLTTLRLT